MIDKVLFWSLFVVGVWFVIGGLMTGDMGRSAFGGVCLLFALRNDDRIKRK